MLIDFRVRPPYKTNLTTSLYNKPAPSPDPTKQSIFLIGKERVPSAEARSIELFMQEMDETETERAVIMGRKADEYGHSGGGKALIDSFTASFGRAFDSSVHTITDYVEAGPVNIGGIDLVILPTQDAFDVEIPAIGAVYTHMLGHDCHSIVAGAVHADAIIRQLTGYLDKGYKLILTSHYTPEDLKDVQTKIDYLEDLKAIAARCGDAETFRAEVRRAYPAYSGENYLEMTAGFFFG